MKHIILLIVIFSTKLSFGQVKRHLDDIDVQLRYGRFSPFTMNKKMMEKEIDSLGKLYNVEAIGYTKSVVKNNETLILHYVGNNGEIKQCKTQKLRLIEPDPEELQYPDVTFSSIINLPSADFQKIVRDLSCISEKLEIKSVGNELIFKCSGQFASAEIHRAESDGSMGFILKQDSSKIIQGEFSLKNLGYFIKCTNLCQQIEMYLENDLPLVIKYNVASLGSIKLCLSNLPSS